MYSIRNKKTAVIVSKTANRQRQGTSLIEVMLAVAILVIVLIGTSTTYVSGRKHIVDQRYYRAAAQLASQKLEELRSASYADVNECDEEEEFSAEGLTYLRQTEIELTSEPNAAIPKPCKKATVTISWSLGDNQHQARLVTYIGP